MCVCVQSKEAVAEGKGEYNTNEACSKQKTAITEILIAFGS